MLAAVCGDAMIWKPSLVTPLCAIAMTNVAHEVMREQDVFQPEGCDPCDLFGLIIGTDDEVGETMIADRRLPLISATGSCRMGRHVGTQVAKRLGRCLLELGGNNAIIVTPHANLDLALPGIVFGIALLAFGWLAGWSVPPRAPRMRGSRAPVVVQLSERSSCRGRRGG